jgi:mannan endo-1,4-beta-mannosidase
MPLSPLRVAPGGRYFETFDGEPFLMVGFNDAISWQGLNGLYRRRDLVGARHYLEDLRGHGINTIRLMLEYVHREGRYFERRVGEFNPDMVRLWDDLFEICEGIGLRVLLTPWDTFWMTRRWKFHPYNAANGGPAREKHSVLTDDAVIEVLIARFRFVIERWGQSGVIGAWDLWNEIWTHWGGTIEDQEKVFSRISEAVRNIEMEKWGWTRPQTISIYGPNLAHGYENLIFRHPNIDFATSHIYAAGTIDDPKNTVNPALTMRNEVRYALSHVPPHYPFLDTEHGPIHLFNDKRKALPEDFDDEYERHLMWAHLASGGAGSGMRWPARDPHILTWGTKRSLHSLSKFLPLIDWRHFAPRDALPDTEIHHLPQAGERKRKAIKNIQIFGCRDESQALIWLLRGNPVRNKPGMLPKVEPEPGELLQCHWQAGNYTVQEWNTARGEAGALHHVQVGSDGALQCVLPRIGNDLALAIRRVN